MNDKFLKDYRTLPRPEFIQNMRRRFDIREETAMHEQRLRFSPVGLVTVALLLVLVLVLTISPAARAQVEDWVGVVGGVLFTATGDYPGNDGVPVSIVPSDEMTLEEARKVLPFAIDLPAYVPEGFVLEETVRIPHFEDGIGRIDIQWRAPYKGLSLHIEDRSPEEANWLVAPGSMEEVFVDGASAALVRGGWYENTKQWENKGHLQLFVSHNGQTYLFSTNEDNIPVEELIHIAESLP